MCVLNSIRFRSGGTKTLVALMSLLRQDARCLERLAAVIGSSARIN